MKRLLFAIGILSLAVVKNSGAYFSSQTAIGANRVSAGCWALPTQPILLSPANGTFIGLNSDWWQNPVLVWENSQSSCPLARLSYQLEVYTDKNLQNLYYQSDWLSEPISSIQEMPDGSYFWRVRARDQFNHIADFTEQWFFAVDRLAPQISEPVVAEKTSRSAVIEWQTNKPATSQIIYGSDSDEVFKTPMESGFTTNHRVLLSNLFSARTYHFQILSRDQAQNEVVSENFTLRTLSEAGDIVINELMWMGSGFGPYDEWLELRNTKSYPVDISGFKLTKKTDLFPEGEEMMTVPQGKIIPALGFFLISHFGDEESKIKVSPNLVVGNKLVLRNESLQIKLYAGEVSTLNLVDIADDGQGKPLAGTNKNTDGNFYRYSMQRKEIAGDGTLAENWETCYTNSLEEQGYWDEGVVLEKGTPGGRNLFGE